MAFLDNSGDIILDAVLTDTGRKRLARGDGSFQIVKFALADDEIDYSLYENANHSTAENDSGSAYYDLNIMMTPIFEAFTNNTATMKSKLISLPRQDLLYMPVLRLNTTQSGDNNRIYTPLGLHVITVDSNTKLQWSGPGGVHDGTLTGGPDRFIRVDQGIDNTSVPNTSLIEATLREGQYIIEMDSRFGELMGNAAKSVSYIDDDEIASYYISSTDTDILSNAVVSVDGADTTYAVSGARGTVLKFKIKSSVRLSSNDYLFDTLGSTTTDNSAPDDTNYKYIDTNIRVTGATTGASIDIPVRYVKKALII